ncbi:hypothetical protein [Streptomyces formicae]|uniref:Lipoprotein n=1 Tax=Streptomyces formicae TaxID=1616117 RepID=A0ABY3WEF2_9ACTN|nr:hypothetical protein [Streptomyces formicae]UNM10939.1 hypothetical protein J4032_04880 [Streptomyces formicae]
MNSAVSHRRTSAPGGLSRRPLAAALAAAVTGLLAACASATPAREAAPPEDRPAAVAAPSEAPASGAAPKPVPQGSAGRAQTRAPSLDTPTSSPEPARSATPGTRRPVPSAEPATPKAAAKPAKPSSGKSPSPEPTYNPKVTTIHIGKWSRSLIRGGQEEVDACKAAVLFEGPVPGKENGFEMNTSVIVGHDFCGFDHFADLPVGTDVRITSPKGELKYRVYANYITPGQGGSNSGLYWGDITLQSCLGPDTGFSYLERVSPARES